MRSIARIVIPGFPHHVTQRRNPQQRTFFKEGDYALYLDLLMEGSANTSAGEAEICIDKGIEQITIVADDGTGESPG